MKHLIATGRYAQGRWHIGTEGMMDWTEWSAGMRAYCTGQPCDDKQSQAWQRGWNDAREPYVRAQSAGYDDSADARLHQMYERERRAEEVARVTGGKWVNE